jgi:hypothetical protein
MVTGKNQLGPEDDVSGFELFQSYGSSPTDTRIIIFFYYYCMVVKFGITH